MTQATLKVYIFLQFEIESIATFGGLKNRSFAINKIQFKRSFNIYYVDKMILHASILNKTVNKSQ